MSLNQILNYFPISDNLATGGQPQREQFLDIARAGFYRRDQPGPDHL
jgi:hypothetical protein